MQNAALSQSCRRMAFPNLKVKPFTNGKVLYKSSTIESPGCYPEVETGKKVQESMFILEHSPCRTLPYRCCTPGLGHCFGALSVGTLVLSLTHAA
eukprot:1160730-Pelagomonas_calceolata.AAC.3